MTFHKRLWRIIKYLYYKLLRSEGTPHSIALAVAIGVFVGCIIPIGIWGQTVVSIVVAIKFRTNPGIAYAATWVSNPYSVIFMYPAYCYVGSHIIGHSMTFIQIKETLMEVIHNFSWHTFGQLGYSLALSYFVGAVIFGLIGSIIGYYVIYFIMNKYKQNRARRKTLKKMKRRGMIND
ncbi:MAG: DUF2062 domain-containing protein [Victivallales bacterium]|nr:DUF2062 domain-containing protein [Victivallales bacterium]MCF7888710.1 DUF2062 domain-containing protein [Victivallales bacterium]